MGSRYIVRCISDSEFEVFRRLERWWLLRGWVCRLAWVGSDSLGIDADGVAFLPKRRLVMMMRGKKEGDKYFCKLLPVPFNFCTLFLPLLANDL
jgi:hypothetical protein